MLVALSDLHLSDGRTATNVPAGAFNILEAEIRSAIMDRGATEVHLVLLGDILDFVRTDYWHRKAKDGTIPPEKRPWNGTLDPATGMNTAPGIEAQFREILGSILDTPSARELLDLIGRLKAAPLPLRVTYVVGNHDRVLHNFPSLQHDLRLRLPGVDLKFATVVREGPYGLVARHGHEWDEHCHGWQFRNKVLKPGAVAGRFDGASYRVMAIGEVVTAELMSGLIFRVAEGIGGDPGGQALVQQLKDANNLRPALKVFQWLEWLGGNQARKFYPILYDALKASLDTVIECELGRQWDKLKNHLLPGTGDLIDHLEDVRRFALGSSFDQFRGRVHALAPLIEFFSGSKDPHLEGAISEMEAETDPAIQFILYGHTHLAKHEYLAGERDGRGRIYVNTGTYLPLICLARDGRTFASARQMTMAFAYSDKEDTKNKRAGPSLDVWAGIRRKLYTS